MMGPRKISSDGDVNLLLGLEAELHGRRVDCVDRRGHGPWVPLVQVGAAITGTTRLVECAHCAERAIHCVQSSARQHRKD